jgi:hypothetical protein
VDIPFPEFGDLLGGGGDLFENLAWWKDGNHFVIYAGSRKAEAVVAGMVENAKTGGLTGHPLFQRSLKTGDFESVARGYIDTTSVVNLVKSLAGPLVPGLKERLDELGFTSLKAIVFSLGFEGKEARSLWEFDVPGERKGITKVLKNKPLGLADLPPLPPDVNRFTALRLDFGALYDAGVGLFELLGGKEEFGVEGEAKTPAELIKARKDYLKRELDKTLGFNVAEDLIPHLGDKFVMYQSPSEGLLIFGTVVCISVKDAAKVKAALDRLPTAIEQIVGNPVKVKKKVLKGVEIIQLHSQGFMFLTPSYAIVDGWLVIGVHPQVVQGFVLRSKGELEKWKPDAAVAARLAKMPKDGCGMQYCDPKATTTTLCTVGPLLLGLFFNRDGGGDDGKDFDPFDVGLIPNAHELNKHLFPNLTVFSDDGKTIRLEKRSSLWLPLETIGLESLLGAFALFGLR